MNLFDIFGKLEKVDPELGERVSFNRRKMFGQLTSLAAAAVPVAAATLLKKSYAGPKDAITDVLNYALTLEYLENKFYATALASTVIPAADKAVFTQIGKHEQQHVAFLKGALAANAAAEPTFDFTAKGTFRDVFTNYQTFLALSQAFEDTGVRAYKGQATALMGDDALLTYALQIHAVEARHASVVRRLRGQKGWITNNDGGGTPAAIYTGEDNVSQGGVDITTLALMAGTKISKNAATEAFDEPLSMEQVLPVAKLFIV